MFSWWLCICDIYGLPKKKNKKKPRQTKIHRVLHKSLTLSYEILFDIAKPLKIAITGKKLLKSSSSVVLYE